MNHLLGLLAGQAALRRRQRHRSLHVHRVILLKSEPVHTLNPKMYFIAAFTRISVREDRAIRHNSVPKIPVITQRRNIALDRVAR